MGLDFYGHTEGGQRYKSWKNRFYDIFMFFKFLNTYPGVDERGDWVTSSSDCDATFNFDIRKRLCRRLRDTERVTERQQSGGRGAGTGLYVLPTYIIAPLLPLKV